MRARLTPIAIAVAIAGLSSSLPARAANEPGPVPAARDVDAIDRTARAAYDEEKYAFCKEPSRPLGIRQQGLCSLAAEIEECEGFAKACNVGELPKDKSWLERMAEWLGPAAKGLLYLLVLGIVVVAAIPVARALLKWRRDRKLASPTPDTPNRALVARREPILAEEVSDAEAALRLAEEHRTRGELKRALGLYLAASLAALDRRGAIRIARHRTNGEYVRGCEEEASRPSLREIVREVDKVEFGGAPPTDEGLSRVASRAQAIVRVTTSTLSSSRSPSSARAALRRGEARILRATSSRAPCSRVTASRCARSGYRSRRCRSRRATRATRACPSSSSTRRRCRSRTRRRRT